MLPLKGAHVSARQLPDCWCLAAELATVSKPPLQQQPPSAAAEDVKQMAPEEDAAAPPSAAVSHAEGTSAAVSDEGTSAAVSDAAAEDVMQGAPQDDSAAEDVMQGAPPDESAAEGDAAASPSAATSPAPSASATAAAAGDKEQHETLGMHTPGWRAPDVYCATCGSMVAFERVRALSKKASTWRRSTCHSRITQIGEKLGSRWHENLQRIPAEELQDFFRACAKSDGKQTCRRMQDLLTKCETHEMFLEDAGEFFPLSVWSQRSFNCDDIETKSGPQDRQEHPVLGTTYRVRVMKTGSRGAKGERQAQDVTVAA